VRILLLNYEFPPLGGGGGVACFDVARHLAKRHHVDVVTTGFEGVPSFELRDGVRIHRVPVLARKHRETATKLSMLMYLPAAVRTVLQLSRTQPYDVMNTWFAVPTGPVGALLSRLLGLPNLLTLVGGDLYDPSKRMSPHRSAPMRAAVRWVLRSATSVTAISSDTMARARDYFGFSRAIEVIQLGVDRPEFSPAERTDLGLSDDKFYVVSVGRLVPRKAFADLIAAMVAIDAAEVELLIVGEGPERGRLESLAERLGVANRVHLMGLLSEERKYQLLAASDVFALTSMHEGFGLVFLEAMHCGLPIVATDEGGQRDILEDGKTGFLVQPGDVAAVAAKIAWLRERPEECRLLGLHNRKRASLFSAARCAEAYEELMVSVCRDFRR